MQVRSPILCRRARLFRLSGALHKSLPVTFWSHLVTRGQIPRVRLEAQLPGGVTSEGTPFTVLTLPPAAGLTLGGREVRQSIGGGDNGRLRSQVPSQVAPRASPPPFSSTAFGGSGVPVQSPASQASAGPVVTRNKRWADAPRRPPPSYSAFVQHDVEGPSPASQAPSSSSDAPTPGVDPLDLGPPPARSGSPTQAPWGAAPTQAPSFNPQGLAKLAADLAQSRASVTNVAPPRAVRSGGGFSWNCGSVASTSPPVGRVGSFGGEAAGFAGSPARPVSWTFSPYPPCSGGAVGGRFGLPRDRPALGVR